MENKQPQKLKILCLHGYNMNKDILSLMLKDFQEQFKDTIDFHFIDSSFQCYEEPWKFFVDQGFQGPYKSWIKLEDWKTGAADDKYEKIAPGYISSDILSWKSLINYINDQGPFDGILAFSQGSIFYRFVYRLTQEIDTTLTQVKLPTFMLSFSGPFFPHQKLIHQGNEYPPQGHKTSFEIVHVYGEKDPYIEFLENYQQYTTNAKAIVHREGHKIPREIPNQIFQIIKQKHSEKNSSHSGNSGCSAEQSKL